MSTETQEFLEICEQLPRKRREEVADFAQFLLARESDERWEQIIADPKRRPRKSGCECAELPQGLKSLVWPSF